VCIAVAHPSKLYITRSGIVTHNTTVAQSKAAQTPEQRQFAETEKAIGGKPAYEKAKAAGKTKLNYGQWVQVRTPAFKAWFGDWEAVRGAKQLSQAKPLVLDGVKPLDGKKAIEEAFSSFVPVTNANDGRVITFPNSMAGKVARHKGFDVGRIAGAFDQLLQSAVPMMSQAEQAREGHKDHTRNIVAYHHYVNKFNQDGKSYFVRFSVQEMRVKQGAKQSNKRIRLLSQIWKFTRRKKKKAQTLD
jgi:hypothetical protein